MTRSGSSATGAASPRPATGLTLDDLAVEPGSPVGDARLPAVAIVILNYNGRHHLEDCFTSLRALDYPEGRLRVIVVDNGSSDGSVDEIRARHSWVLLHPNERNLGFSEGCNQGGDLAEDAEVLVFLNNDMRVEPGFVRELVAPIVRGECVCTTGKMLSWDGKLVNSAGGGMNFHGIGIQQGYLEEPAPAHDVARRTLFACGGAMAIRRDVFRAVGGFDTEFFAYYEDVDLGWRLWVLGHEIHYAPRAVCYHHHSSTSRTFPRETIRLLQVRNPVLACFKNYDDEHLRQVLPAALALALRRAVLVSGVEDTAYRIQNVEARRPTALQRLTRALRRRVAEDREGVGRLAVADLVGLNDLLGNWDHWLDRRREVQSRRRRADEEIFRLFLKPLWCIEAEPAYQELHRGLASLMGLDALFEDLTIPGPDPAS